MGTARSEGHITEPVWPRRQTKFYPPYNIEKLTEDSYQITMAVAGFSEDDIDITIKENSLLISGQSGKETDDTDRTYLHRGIASRSFERRFDLADHIIVTGADLENGLLNISLVREIPEEKKPKKKKKKKKKKYLR